MVAITVILAAVIGTFVLGLGGSISETPTATFSYDFDRVGTPIVNITHDGGDTLRVGDNTNRVHITSTDSTAPDGTKVWASRGGNETLQAGDTYPTYEYGENGSTVRVVWFSLNNDSSATLSSQQSPV